MDILSRNELTDQYLSQIKEGSVFIYPTDTIYGIGCDATNDFAVKRIRELKMRDAKPFSVIAPSFEWIKENCEAHSLDKLPGPYTIIMKLKNKGCISQAVNNDMETVGIRIPKHWIADVVNKVGVPLVTTSVNLTGKKPLQRLEALKTMDVDFMIYEGEQDGTPSTIIDLSGNEIKR